MKNRVRYICVPVTSFELADALPEHEKAVFIEQVLRMFKACEACEDPVPEKTESRVLDIALDGAAREIKTGYDNYIQRITARSGNKTEIGDQSAVDQRSNDDDSADGREEKQRELFDENKRDSSETLIPLSEIELKSIESALSYAGIRPDNAFYTYAKKVGYRRTIDAIRRARDEKSQSLAYVVKLMKKE